nr:skin secretory protein xP2-like [Penaeus vannamei]
MPSILSARGSCGRPSRRRAAPRRRRRSPRSRPTGPGPGRPAPSVHGPHGRPARPGRGAAAASAPLAVSLERPPPRRGPASSRAAGGLPAVAAPEGVRPQDVGAAAVAVQGRRGRGPGGGQPRHHPAPEPAPQAAPPAGGPAPRPRQYKRSGARAGAAARAPPRAPGEAPDEAKAKHTMVLIPASFGLPSSSRAAGASPPPAADEGPRGAEPLKYYLVFAPTSSGQGVASGAASGRGAPQLPAEAAATSIMSPQPVSSSSYLASLLKAGVPLVPVSSSASLTQVSPARSYPLVSSVLAPKPPARGPALLPAPAHGPRPRARRPQHRRRGSGRRRRRLPGLRSASGILGYVVPAFVWECM